MNAAQALAEQFDDMRQQVLTAGLGMWVFLASEVLFFGGLFAVYTVSAFLHPEGFYHASSHTHLVLGTINSALLLTSSFTMALGVIATKAGQMRGAIWWMAATLVLGVVFMGIKGVEYAKEWEEGLVPAFRFTYEGPHTETVEMFFFLYYVMTGLHLIHLLVGLGAVAVMMVLTMRDRFSSEYFTPVEMTGIYMTFVDIVWVFLFPVIYLVGR